MVVRKMATQHRDGTVLEAKKAKAKPPPMFKVMLLNDDYTPMDFVVVVLQQFFSLSREQATQVMLKVHRDGAGVCGVFPRDVAATKVEQVLCFARQHQHPLAVRDGGKLMIAQELEVSLHMAFMEARQKRHEFITVEHLLLALLDNPSASEVLQRLRGQDRRPAQTAGGFRHRTHADPRQRRSRYAADAGFPARDPARDPACAVLGQEGSHRRQRAGGDLRRKGFARGLFPAPEGRDPPRCREFHFPRHQQGAAGQQPEGRRRGRNRAGADGRRRAGNLHAQSECAGASGQDRSADRARTRTRARDPDAVPPAQEQSAAGRRSRRRQDRDRRRPGAAHRRGRCAGHPGQEHGLRAGHGRAAGRHQIPRRFRAAAEGGAEAADRQSERDPVHRRNPHADRRRRRLGRHAGRVESAEAGAVDRAAEMHWRDHLQEYRGDVREGPRAVAALPENRRHRAVALPKPSRSCRASSRASKSITASSTRRRR